MPENNLVDQSPATLGQSQSHSRKRRWLRILLWAAGGLVALLLIVVAVVVLWLRAAEKAALSVLDGDVHIAGLSAPVTVRRDVHGVPHIETAT